ncbi:putative transcription factor lepB, partial [Lachnellula cervina]
MDVYLAAWSSPASERLFSLQAPPSYQDLLEENRRLKAEIAGQTIPSLSTEDVVYGEALNITESFERELFEAVGGTGRASTVFRDDQVQWPSAECVRNLLVYGRTWTSWMHCALHHPTFEAECHEFLEGSGRNPDPFWLAIYFSFISAALIFMNGEEAEAAGINQQTGALLLNWYDSALYFLQRADFLRRWDVRTVQATAILGIVSINVGDSKMQSVLWACAIRIAQFLNMGNDRAHQNESLLLTETRRRLWWTLVICEWIPIPYHAPCISQADFQIELPATLDDEELQSSSRLDDLPRPIQYHIVMIQLAKIYHRFRSALNLVSGKAADIVTLVLQTDEALADNIAGLPPHLQFEISSSSSVTPDIEKPWIQWQRINISLILLYYRIAVNRVLQNQWVQDPTTFARTRAICLDSARGIISLASTCTDSLARHRPWATSLHLFSAAIILGVEARFHADESKQQYVQDIQFCVKFLNGVKDQSIIATHAVQILEQQFSDEH